MTRAGIASAVLSVSTPGTTFLSDPAQAAELARAVNDYSAALAHAEPGRFGFFATLPMPDTAAVAAEARRSLDDQHADGVVLLANAPGSYLGELGQDELFDVLNQRSAVAFVHPAGLPAPAVPGVAPFAADFLLDTTRAAYLLVRDGIRRRYPDIRFVLAHAGGFVPYAAHRMEPAIFDDTGRSPAGRARTAAWGSSAHGAPGQPRSRSNSVAQCAEKTVTASPLSRTSSRSRCWLSIRARRRVSTYHWKISVPTGIDGLASICP